MFLTGESDQRASVFHASLLADALDGSLVAGKFGVPPGKRRRQPKKWIIPVHGEAETAQHRPDVVAMAVMGQLMRQYVMQFGFIPGNVRRDIYCGAEKSEQAGRR
ncbi:hypothetical protein SDC9_87802 [bioreactor metagenome]|uniref:Uncharacterized protein n=1 Tax=bioreactor metagenome TaxID=1076179 RepID=A0A644ZJU6_9ZZZZ